MVTDRCDQLRVTEIGDQASPDRRMLLHDHPLGVVQRALLPDDLYRDADLPDVVEAGSEP
jgi:hypothetical protein